MMDRHGDIEVVITRHELAADRVALICVRTRTGMVLPPWTPGAHIDVITPDGREAQYSLCGDPYDRHTWRIGVLREHGVSAYLHDEVRQGSSLTMRGPRNHFAFAPFPGKRYLFIAGGIGITAIHPMLASADRSGNDFTLVYAGRSTGAMAFAPELTERYGDRVRLYPGDQGVRADLAGLLAAPDPNTIIYTCGPARLLDAVQGAVESARWPRGALHIERFAAKVLGPPVWPGPFEVDLLMSGETVTVPPDRSILDVVEELGVPVLSSCRVGTCGTCEVPIINGEVEHRDSVLSPEEQEDNMVMMICVSRAGGPRITLEL